MNTKDEKVDDCSMVGMAGRICSEVQLFLTPWVRQMLVFSNLVSSTSESTLNYKEAYSRAVLDTVNASSLTA